MTTMTEKHIKKNQLFFSERTLELISKMIPENLPPFSKKTLNLIRDIFTFKDPLIDLIENPAHIEREKIKGINLDTFEEELWGE